MTSTARAGDPTSESREETRAILEGLGLDPVINAVGRASQLGGAILTPGVRAAMNAAAQHALPMSEIQQRAATVIAELTDAEAGCIASGADACLFLAAAACMTGADPAAMDRLPDTTGLANEVVVHRAHRTPFDHALRAAGARLVEFGYVGPGSGVGAYRWQLDAAITEQTVAILYVYTGSKPWPNVLELETVVEVAHAHGLPVIVDGAGADLAGLRALITMGADLVAVSGGKAIGGPAGSGLLAGRLDLVRAASMQQQDMHVHPDLWSPLFGSAQEAPVSDGPPHQGIGRSMKVGREEAVGLIAALLETANRDTGAEEERCLAVSTAVVETLAGLEDVDVRLIGPPEWPAMVQIQLPTARRAHEVAAALAAGRPRIWVGSINLGNGTLWAAPMDVHDDEVPVLIERLRAVLKDERS